jgi:hypothetical protein
MKIQTNNFLSFNACNFQPVDPARLSADLGGKWHRHYGVAPCPVCQPERRKDQNALTINLKGDKLLLHCKKSGCDFREILSAAGIAPGHVEIDRQAVVQAELARREQEAKLKARARGLWDQGKSITGTTGETYLRARGITCALPDTLRWLADTYHKPSGQNCGAIVADVQPTGGVHRTFFTKKGERLNKSAKMMLGPCAGGAVRLSESIGPLVVCEGIETGLSLLSGFLDGPHTVWAALSTSGMKGLALPSRAGTLIVAADGDAAGREAAHWIAKTATGLGWQVSMMQPPDGQDFNDVLQSEVTA